MQTKSTGLEEDLTRLQESELYVVCMPGGAQRSQLERKLFGSSANERPGEVKSILRAMHRLHINCA